MYVHFDWGTLRRQRLINVEAESELFRTILAKSLKLGCVPCAVGGTVSSEEVPFVERYVLNQKLHHAK